jgi:hypothetical protein
MSPEANSVERPASVVPFTATTTSPDPSPARLAGELGNTASTRSPRLSGATLMPTPENLPSVERWKAANALGSK